MSIISKHAAFLAAALFALGTPLSAAAADSKGGMGMGMMGESEDDLAIKEPLEDLLARGKEIYEKDGQCFVCHGMKGEGVIGPTLQNKPRSPQDISIAFKTVPRMAPFVNELKPEKRDYLALAYFQSQVFAKTELTDEIKEEYGKSLKRFTGKPTGIDFKRTAHELKIEEIEHYEVVELGWERRAKKGPIKRDYPSEILATWEWPESDIIFTPEPGKTYWVENTGIDVHPAAADRLGVEFKAKSGRVTVGDAATKEILATRELPLEMKGNVHSTFVTPDGKYAYISGGQFKPGVAYTTDTEKGDQGEEGILEALSAPATMIKVELSTLKPVKQIDIGGRIHHGQIFQGKYLLIDTFVTSEGGLDVFMYDPETDKVIGGVQAQDLGGSAYTAWTDHKHIYVLMEPAGYDPMSLTHTGYLGATKLKNGTLMTMRNFWIAKIDPETWEVVREYTYPGFRGDWIEIDAKSEFAYIPAAGSNNISKINLKTGELAWANAAGVGPYGASLNADESEVWVANKGESSGMFGRTLSVLDAKTGWGIHTIYTGFMTDHVLLSPNGKEMWATSNGEGRIYVFDAKTYEQITVMDMPDNGDPHGLVWIHADEKGETRVVRDQGGWHGGIFPAKGKALDY